MRARSSLALRLSEGFESWYYNLEPGMPVAEVIKLWLAGKKAYDISMPQFYTPEELWPYREYTWSAATARDGTEYYSILRSKLKKEGWDTERPLHMAVGKNGKARVAEGNHRLAIARELGIRQVPVWFHFQDRA